MLIYSYIQQLLCADAQLWTFNIKSERCQHTMLQRITTTVIFPSQSLYFSVYVYNIQSFQGSTETNKALINLFVFIKRPTSLSSQWANPEASFNMTSTTVYANTHPNTHPHTHTHTHRYQHLNITITVFKKLFGFLACFLKSQVSNVFHSIHFILTKAVIILCQYVCLCVAVYNTSRWRKKSRICQKLPNTCFVKS